MMKHRDLIFLAVPLSVLVLVAVAIGLLVHQFRAFERAYIQDARQTLAQDARFVAQVIAPDLAAGRLEAIQETFAFFRGKPLRFTLVAPDGKVAADSDADAAALSNHADRPEIRDVASDDDFVTRYSVTMNAWLLYHAMPLDGGWVLRASLPADAVGAAISQARLAVILALCAGLALALALALYLFLRVRPHFNALQASAVAVARGRLDTPIGVPADGPLRELAKAVAVMARQLRNRIDELRRERDDFDTLFNTLREPLLLVAPNGAILRSNRAAAKLFGEAVARPGFRIERTACPELIAYVRAAFDEPALHGREIPFDDGGTPRALLAHAVRMEREGALCILLLLTDLTDLRRLESFRSDFVANVSHEIKTPLAAILSTVETLTDLPLDDAGRRHCLDILSRQARRLNDLVQDILSLAAIERRQSAGARDFHDLRLDALANDALALVQDDAERAGVTLRTDPTPLPPVTLRGDAHLLEQTLVNLLSNALRHSGSPTVTLGLKAEGRHALLTVADQGCGIAPEHLPRLFERFYRVHADRSRENGGTGLGLAIVKHVALLHHGSVDVRSAPGQGTVFTLRLPLPQPAR